MKMNIFDFMKSVGVFLLAWVFVFSGIISCKNNRVATELDTLFTLGTVETTPQAEAFVRAYQENLGARTAANGGVPLLVEYRIGPASDSDVCSNGLLYGPYTVTDNSVDGDQTVSADKPTLQLVNMGDLAVCTIITAPVNVTMSAAFDNVYMDNEPCIETALDVSGIWQGAYSCDSQPASHCEDIGGVVKLNIMQDEHGASYSDGLAKYNGPVCGNRFEYSGGGPGYTESGTFVLNQDGTASKTSHYEDDDGGCSGDCSDPELVKISQVALFDHFEGPSLDEAWTVDTVNTTDGVEGWTYSFSNSSINVSDVAAATIHSENGQTWSQLELFQQLDTSLSDFIAEFDISWTSDDVTAMQYLRLSLQSEEYGHLATVGYSDSWIGSHGGKQATIWANPLNIQPNGLSASGTATIRISRTGEITRIEWDGAEIHDGYAYGGMDQVYLTFGHYPYDDGEGAASSLGSLSVDKVRILGVAWDEFSLRSANRK